MIVLNVYLNNLYSFKNFRMNLVYPKKIVGSSIKEEHLNGYKNFRYKKINIIYGTNASGKTTFGKMLMKIFNFIDSKNYNHITNAICDNKKEASFEIDLASENGFLYYVKCVIMPCIDGKYISDNIKIQVIKEKIRNSDSYESCISRIDRTEFMPCDNYVEELEKMEELAWLFEYPPEGKRILNLPNKDEKFRYVLENTLKVLDASIIDVKISQDVDNAYVIHLKDNSVIIQSGDFFETDLLSSGTKAGVEIANVLSSLIQGKYNFYYCDEKFSYINSDIEKAILSLMIDFVGESDQLFFTTHNTDILDLNLPKHSFTFLRKDVTNTECPITCVDASSYLKRNTDSLRSAVENDLFCTAPDLELIYDITNIIDRGNDYE